MCQVLHKPIEMRYARFVLVYILHLFVSDSFCLKETQEKCDVVKNRCMARVGCGMALQNFLLGCNSLIHGESLECHDQCTRALILLLSTDEQGGVSFTDCDCGSDTMCQMEKGRIELCSKPVLRLIRALNDSTVVNCDMAKWLCQANAACQRALMYKMEHCKSLEEGLECTKRCNDSLAILYRHTKAAKLINCSCNEDEECAARKENRDRLCFHKSVPYKLHSSSATATLCLCRYIIFMWMLTLIPISPT